jgi:hypothetical protein
VTAAGPMGPLGEGIRRPGTPSANLRKYREEIRFERPFSVYL